MAAYRVLAAARGNRPEEYEDASDADPATGRFAVADGATEKRFARLWARLLVEEFVQHPEKEPQSWTDRLPALQAKWQVAVGRDRCLGTCKTSSSAAPLRPSSD